MQARSQGGGGGGRPPPKKKCKQKGEGEREKKKKNKVTCMHVKLPPFNHFHRKNKYKFVLYEENIGHMHQIAPLTTSKCKKLLLWEGEPPPTPSSPSLGLGRFASLPRTLFFTAPYNFILATPLLLCVMLTKFMCNRSSFFRAFNAWTSALAIVMFLDARKCFFINCFMRCYMDQCTPPL